MIGLDLKRCIINICQGEVKEDEVDFIIFDLCHVKTDKEIRDVCIPLPHQGLGQVPARQRRTHDSGQG
jgi:hypothetical protein